MPSGKTHERVNLALGSILALTGLGLGVDANRLLAFWAGFLFATYFLSPDLDLEGTRAHRRWGPLAPIWSPYAALIPHRGISHIPVLGTLIRIGYLTLVYVLLAFVLQVFWGIRFPLQLLSVLYYGPFLLGAIVSDLTHIVLDRTVTALKRRG